MEEPSTSKTGEQLNAIKINKTFNTEVMKNFLKSHCTNPKTKINNDAAELMCSLAKILTMEACLRAVKQARLENKKTITFENMENITPQLMLDFP